MSEASVGSSMSRKRLAAERKAWRKDRPYGFFAKPQKKEDNSINLHLWNCGVPGKEGTDWEGGIYLVELIFPETYPRDPPKAKFNPKIDHPNVFPSGAVCLSILSADKDWAAKLTVKEILLGIQDLLDNPNVQDPANGEAAMMLQQNPEGYRAMVREQAARFKV